jgi:dolichol-phosphate mannosyltransferase
VLSPAVLGNFFSSAVIAFSDIPLKLSSWFGALISLGSLAYSAWLGIELLLGQPIPSWSFPLAFLSFLSGVQLFSIGLLGLYIGAINLESKRRPNYIVKSSFGFPHSPHPAPQDDPTSSRPG